MKKLVLSVFALSLFAFNLKAQTPTTPATTTPSTTTTPAVNPNAGEFKFETESHDFSTIKEGTQATWEFRFTNVGNEPIVISNVQASCGCTTPKWSKEPVKKGESGIVTAVYNSKGRPGSFNKAITVTSNAKTGSKVLYIKGNVEAAPAADPAMETTPVKKDQSGPMEKKAGGF